MWAAIHSCSKDLGHACLVVGEVALAGNGLVVGKLTHLYENIAEYSAI